MAWRKPKSDGKGRECRRTAIYNPLPLSKGLEPRKHAPNSAGHTKQGWTPKSHFQRPPIPIRMTVSLQGQRGGMALKMLSLLKFSLEVQWSDIFRRLFDLALIFLFSFLLSLPSALLVHHGHATSTPTPYLGILPSS